MLKYYDILVNFGTSQLLFSDFRAMEEFCRYVHSDIVASLAEIIAATSDHRYAAEISDQGLL